MLLSVTQRRIIAAILKALDSEGNERVRGVFCIPAVAGAGKTVTVTELARALGDRRIVYMCFNRNIVQRAQGALPANVKVRTLHALAHEFLSHSHGQKIAAGGLVHRLAAGAIAAQLGISHHDARLARATLERFYLSGQRHLGEEHLDAHHAWQAGERRRIVACALELWQRQQDSSDRTTPLSYDALIKLWAQADPIYLDVVDSERGAHGGNGERSRRLTPFGTADILILDEAQDAPEVVLDFLARQSQLLICIGDPHQETRQSAPQPGLEHPLLHGATRFELSHSYRFGAPVAAALNAIIAAHGGQTRQGVAGLGRSRLEAPTARAALERHGLHYTLIARTLGGALGEAIALRLAGKRLAWVDGIYAYNVALLRDLAWLERCRHASVPPDHPEHPRQQLREHIRARYRSLDDARHDFERNNDRDGLDLIALVEAHRHLHLPRLINQLTWEERERQTHMQAHCDQPPPPREVTLATVQRAKGLEFDRVVLGSDFDSAAHAPSSPQRRRELNMLYTAASRARHVLVINEALQRLLAAQGAALPEDEIAQDHRPPARAIHPYFGASIETLMEMSPRLRGQRRAELKATEGKESRRVSGQAQLKAKMLEDARTLDGIRPGEGGVRGLVGMRVRRKV